ncbi:MazG-like family protein [Pseudophaeobacter sp.]|uniref:MazG-like family protein n=1 Tax=Pseudophaeobacter sp. TaxID=1971739 RepID=UPI003A96D38C
MQIDFKQLRIANIARQAEWPGNEHADLAFRALEVADEAGELMGAIKKVARAQRGIAGSTLSLQDVADEMGDTVISLDLLAIKVGVDLGQGSRNFTSRSPLLEQALNLDAVVGDLSDSVVMFLMAQSGEGDSLEEAHTIFENLQRSIFWVTCIALALGVDLGQAVAAKFNATSVKYGLTTRFETAGAASLRSAAV